MVSAKAIELIAHAIETSRDSYDKIAAATNISKTTLSRLVQKHTASRYTLDVLAAYFEIGEKYQELVGSADQPCAYAAELAEELRNTRAYYEQKAVSVRQYYEEQLTSLRDINARQEQERTRERETQERNYEKNVSYLKQQVEIMQAARRDDRAEIDAQRQRAEKAEAEVKERDRKRHNVFWGMLAAIIVITIAFTIAFVIALFSDSIA